MHGAGNFISRYAVSMLKVSICYDGDGAAGDVIPWQQASSTAARLPCLAWYCQCVGRAGCTVLRHNVGRLIFHVVTGLSSDVRCMDKAYHERLPSHSCMRVLLHDEVRAA